MTDSRSQRVPSRAREGSRLLYAWLLCLVALLGTSLSPKAQAAGVEVTSASIAMNIGVSTSARLASPPSADGITMRSIDPSPSVDTKPDSRQEGRQDGQKDSQKDGRPQEARGDTQLIPEGWLLNADVRFTVNARLEDLLEQGIPLHFVTELEAYRPRWYWKDELVLSSSQSVRLSYQAITRQYRVSRGPLSINFSNLGDALRAMGTVRSWRFAEGRALPLRNRYDVYVRFRLDKSQLPKPFQLTMITDSDWVPVSEWKHFSFTTDLTKTAP
jgi:hypothetical protein